MIVASAVHAELPEPTDNYVNDFAVLLTSQEQQSLREQAQTLELDTGVELTIAIIDHVSDYSDDTTIERFATRLFNQWRVGNTELNDGIMILLAREDRAVRIELGAGFGHAYDAQMQRIIDQEMLPSFRQGRYREGLEAGTQAVVLFAQDWHALRKNDSWLGRAWLKIKTAFRSLGVKIFLAFAAGGIGWQIFRRWNRHRQRQCPQCQGPMVRLSEVVDDRYLEPGQRVEERVGSVDYDVWKCTRCAEHRLIDFPSLFTQFIRCEQCGCKTSERQSRNVQDDRVTTSYRCRSCQHCQLVYSTVSDSSSGSSAGFGGGSSGGGGATGRW